MATQLEEQDDDYTEDAPNLDLDVERTEEGDIEPSEAGEHQELLDRSDDDEHDVITFGSAAVAGEDEPEGVRNLRNRLREVERENKALKGQTKVDEVGDKPALDDYWDRPDEYERELLAWNERKRAAEERSTQQERAAAKQQERWEAQRRSLDTGYGDLRASGKDSARAKVEDAFPGEQFAYLVKAAGDNAPGFIFALGNSEERRAELRDLAEEGSWAEFIAKAAVMAREVQVNRRKPETQPEKVRSGASGGGSGRTDTRLERLEADARKTGDRSKLIAYKRENGIG